MTTVASFNPKRIDRARLAANLSHADLAFAIRRATDGRLKPTEQSVRKWICGKHVPSADAVAAIAAATDRDLGFFFEPDSLDDDEVDRTVRIRRMRSELVRAGHDDLAQELHLLAEHLGRSPV